MATEARSRVDPGAGVLAVVVAFFPDPAKFVPLVESLCGQAHAVAVVDNTPAGSAAGVADMLRPLRERFAGLQLVALGENRGIAAAQNIGIRLAIERGDEYVLLSDQDSRPDAGMVAALVATARELQASGIAVGCVCPAYFDEVTGQAFGFQVHPPGRLFYRALPGDRAMPWAEVVTAISSGSLLPVHALQRIGGMREDFFIDQVDIEWCHRARSLGYANFGTARARLVHNLGDAPLRAWCFGWRAVNAYPPTRLYYRFRNFVRMARLPHVPLRWSIRASGYWLLSLYAHCLFAARRRDNAKAIARGLRDGALGRGGRMPAP
jgi:rhamnosyltransferase